MNDTDLYRVLLGVEEPWSITDVNMDEQAETINIHVQLRDGQTLDCPSCGKANCTIKDRRERTWRHLDTCQFKTLVTAPLPRTDCDECGVKTVSPPWALAHSRFTLLFERLAISALLQMSIKGACGLLKITWDEADGIISRAVRRGLAQRDLSKLRRIAIDEKAVLKGHKYITIVSDLDTSKVIWVGFDRTKECLDSFFCTLSPQQRSQIECIAMDMWRPFRASCRQWIPDADAKTVIDRFHVERLVNQAVDNVRRKECAKMDKETDNPLLASRWDWLYNSQNLPEHRRENFQRLQKLHLKTGEAYAIKEGLRGMWNLEDAELAKEYFGFWYSWALESKLEPMVRTAKTLGRHMNRILNYFKSKASTAIAEGLNNKIQTIKKKAYGFKNMTRFVKCIYFHCAGLKLNPL